MNNDPSKLSLRSWFDFNRHVLIAVAISWGLTILIGTLHWAFEDQGAENSLLIPEFGTVILASMVFALMSLLVLQWLSKRIPMTGIIGLGIFILVIIIERFVALKLARIQLVVAFILFLNFSWLMLLGLNTWLAQDESDNQEP